MSKQILYLGDTSLQTAASYLAGCLHHFGWSFDYLPSDQPVTVEHLASPHQLYILSDYPAANFSSDSQRLLVEHVHAGANLLMIGGWESFHGLGGDWNSSMIADLLPVTILQQDDRQNCDSPVIVKPAQAHWILADLPWYDRPPLIGGYNRVTARANGETLLTAERYTGRWEEDHYSISSASSDPLLVVQETNSSRVAALMTDLAPHWVGPMVDWGSDRVAAEAPDAEAVEVGNLYAQFIFQLISWCGQFSIN